MRSIDLSIQRQRPIALGGGRLAGFLAGSAALGSLIIALLVVLADLDDEPDSGFDDWDDAFDEDRGPEDEPARPSSSRRPSRRG
jgi:hypothetical protein